HSGTVARVDALSVGRAANLLGAGRFVKEDRVDPAVGVELVRKVGDEVAKGEPLAILHVNDATNLPQARALVGEAYEIGEGPIYAPALIVERVAAPSSGA
ncbi:MAG: pyrimidine-nucleoside phosphorylase, partial [Candidatus Bipolaricaulota bacterium]|nr:pyrimidine-nucleoside phosphorylase [Candidatus Bipolaricaulota bacterium]